MIYKLILLMHYPHNKLKYLFVLFVLAFSMLIIGPVYGEELEPGNSEWKLTAEQWDLVKKGDQLLTMPVIQEVIVNWSLKPKNSIELHYPGGEEGELWVEELMDWLISLGIASKYMVAVPGSGEADIIIFKLVKVGEL